MTSLPVCNSLEFSASGLLVNDWLLQPTRPLDLTAEWGLWNESVLSSTDKSANFDHLSAFFYLFLPSFPLLLFMFSLANVLQFLNGYLRHTSSRKTETNREIFTLPLLIYTIHICFSSIFNWLVVLVRYIPVRNHSRSNGTKVHPVGEVDSFVGAWPHFLTASEIVNQSTALFFVYLAVKYSCLVRKIKCTDRYKILRIKNDSQHTNSADITTNFEKMCHSYQQSNSNQLSASSIQNYANNHKVNGTKKMVVLNKTAIVSHNIIRNSKQTLVTLVSASVALLLSIIINLPKSWNYSFVFHEDILIVRNAVGHILYEYVSMIIECIIPGFLFILTAFLLGLCLCFNGRTRENSNNERFAQSNPIQSVQVYTVLSIILIHSITWIMASVLGSIQRFVCLLHIRDAKFENRLWSGRKTWMCLDLLRLSSQFLIQMYILLTYTRYLRRPHHQGIQLNYSEIGSGHLPCSSDSTEYDKKILVPANAKQHYLHEDEKTSQNISPMSQIHNFQPNITVNGPNHGDTSVLISNRSYESTPLPYKPMSPDWRRLNGQGGDHASLQLTPVNQYLHHGRPKELGKNYLNYSPRTRHPYLPRNTNVSTCTIPPNTPIFLQPRVSRTNSPPPLPALPVYNLSMIGDASVYSSPPGSPKDDYDRESGVRIMNL